MGRIWIRLLMSVLAECVISPFCLHAQFELYTVNSFNPSPIQATDGYLRLSPYETYYSVGLKPGILERSTSAANSSTKLTSNVYTLYTSINVDEHPSDSVADEGFSYVIAPSEIETSAGTFGDLSHYLQTLAGVVSDNDQRNDFLVRGGNPDENLFVIDSIEVPSINQLALSDTTGGFVSMLDAEAIQQINFHTDAYDERFDQRLSSIVEVSTKTNGAVTARNTTEVGIAGVGGTMTRPLGKDGSYFVSIRNGILQYITNDIGMNGVPHYRNAFVRAEGRIGDRDTIWGMSLTGLDSIQIRPSATDGDETNPYDIDYKGWRNTTGINWQHIFTARLSGTASLAHAAQHQSVVDNAQLLDEASVYNENTTDNITTLKYDVIYQPITKLTFTAGVCSAVDQLNYRVAQPLGLQNPYSADSSPLDGSSFFRHFAAFSSAAYVQAAINLPHHSSLVVGTRGEQWALGGHAGATSKALFSIPVLGRLTHFGYAEYEQLPPTLYLLSFSNIQTLKPIRNRQLTAGMTLADNQHMRLTLELYEKRYQDYPVATNFPQLSMANIVDTFGQAFLMFPMTSKGTGIARGAELTTDAHVGSNLTVGATFTYAHAQYAGLDGILRKGNFDIPIQANLTGVWHMPHNFIFSWHYNITSGVPYTPDNLMLSYSQNRDVYDLSKINAVRSATYRRLDFRVERTSRLGFGQMTWHAGLENAFNTHNFYDQLWQPHSGGDEVQYQMPLFPDGGVKYVF